MITELEKLEMGVEIGKLKCEVIMYAVDILLLANNEDQMQQLLNVVEQFGKKYQIKYNPDKTIFMVFNDKCNQQKRINLKLESKPIERVKVMRYLGQQINENLTNVDHLNKRKQLAYSALLKLRVSGLISVNNHPNMKAQLYKTYIRPVLMYGCENLCLNKDC